MIQASVVWIKSIHDEKTYFVYKIHLLILKYQFWLKIDWNIQLFGTSDQGASIIKI